MGILPLEALAGLAQRPQAKLVGSKEGRGCPLLLMFQQRLGPASASPSQLGTLPAVCSCLHGTGGMSWLWLGQGSFGRSQDKTGHNPGLLPLLSEE